MTRENFFIETPGDCDYLSNKEKTMLYLYSYTINDEKYSADDVESIHNILKECGYLAELLGKKILRKYLVDSIPKWDPESIEAFEATAMVGNIDMELAEWDKECSELSLEDDDSEDDKIEFFAENCISDDDWKLIK
jgi:hypothetical protein